MEKKPFRVTNKDVLYIRGDPSASKNVRNICADLIDAHELIDKQEAIIKEMRSILNECDSDIMEGTVDRVVDILEKTKDYAE